MERGAVLLLTVAAFAAYIMGAATAGGYDVPPAYTNSWAVQVEGGSSAAEALAAKYGFINKGQVSSGVDRMDMAAASQEPHIL